MHLACLTKEQILSMINSCLNYAVPTHKGESLAVLFVLLDYAFTIMEID